MQVLCFQKSHYGRQAVRVTLGLLCHLWFPLKLSFSVYRYIRRGYPVTRLQEDLLACIQEAKTPGANKEMASEDHFQVQDGNNQQRLVSHNESQLIPSLKGTPGIFPSSLVYKPPLAQKSSRVLAIAEEILRQKRREAESSLSDSEIYDDVITFRASDDEVYDDIITMMAANDDETYDDVITLIREIKSGGKPKVPSKPAWLLDQPAPTRRKLLKQRSYEDIYDDIVVERLREVPKPRLYRKPHRKMDELLLKLREKEGDPVYGNQVTTLQQHDHSVDQLQPTTTHNEIAPLSEENHTNSNHEETYLNLQDVTNQDSGVRREVLHTQVNTEQLSHKKGTSSPTKREERLYENECLFAGRVVQYKDDKDTNVTKALSMRKPRSISHDGTRQGFPARPAWRSRTIHPQFTTSAKSQEVTSDSSQTTTPPARSPSEIRTKYDPLPKTSDSSPPSRQLEDLRAQDSPGDDEDSDTYEDLPLYEDLGTYQEEEESPYQNVTQAVVEALGLPGEMRTRVSRITAGQRKKLRKSVKHVQQLRRSQSMPESDLVQAKKSAEEQQSPLPIPEEKSENEKDDGSGEDESIPFGKSRVVFEMLLDASGIERVSEDILTPSNNPMQQLSSKSDTDLHVKKCDHLSEHKSSPYFDSLELDKIYDTPEIRRYQAAGIIQRRTRSEIEEEIKQITASAPLQPPPLPGLNRSRLRVVTRSDRLIHKRFVLKRRQTVQNIETSDQPLQDGAVHDGDRRSSLPELPLTDALSPHEAYDSIPEYTDAQISHEDYDSIPEYTDALSHHEAYDSIPEYTDALSHHEDYDSIPEYTGAISHHEDYDSIPEYTGAISHEDYDSIPEYTDALSHEAYDSIPEHRYEFATPNLGTYTEPVAMAP